LIKYDRLSDGDNTQRMEYGMNQYCEFTSNPLTIWGLTVISDSLRTVKNTPSSKEPLL
jgi:hypothetical protein